MSPKIEKYRRDISKRVKELRQERGLTQTELARELGLSQNRLSELETGEGSFSAEQLLVLAKKFNVPPSSFVDEEKRAEPTLQNALARNGAGHLREINDTLPSEKLDDIIQLVREALVAPQDSRSVAALAPVIVEHADPQILNRIRLRLVDDGIVQRYAWLLENVRSAVQQELSRRLSDEWKKKYERADYVLKHQLAFPWLNLIKADREDVFDTVVTKKTLDQLRSESSKISRKWKVITGIQAGDFANALKESRESR